MDEFSIGASVVQWLTTRRPPEMGEVK